MTCGIAFSTNWGLGTTAHKAPSAARGLLGALLGPIRGPRQPQGPWPLSWLQPGLKVGSRSTKAFGTWGLIRLLGTWGQMPKLHPETARPMGPCGPWHQGQAGGAL